MASPVRRAAPAACVSLGCWGGDKCALTEALLRRYQSAACRVASWQQCCLGQHGLMQSQGVLQERQQMQGRLLRQV